ncbi:hypothetical protein BV372_28280 [Nostoc sp. T09]|uniref:hypothetical protein n=1 Tax=Nostoc sp. T09 TaxID=1932621 RepID=UPI000A3A3990|nr:hypothetical protein [Nostoc sp. T09]OUL24992.1 hypothetical protein BV372_28280 [Nostoc sp. T09]
MMLRAIPFAIATIIIPLTSYSPINATITADYQLSQNPNQSRGITTESLGIGGIKLSMSEAQVRKILGKPVKVENGFMPAIGKVRTLKYAGIIVDLDEGVQLGNFTVYQIKANSSKYSTIHGVKVGDRQSKVLRTYGKVETYQEGNVTNLGYQIEDPSPAGLNFTLKNGKVMEIFCFYVIN